MTEVEIYYFSATGNSLFIARSLSEKLNAKLTPMAPLLNNETVESDAEVVGLVFPIYDFKLPLFVESFTQKLAGVNSKYIFAVASYGVLAQKSLKSLDKILQSHGGKLSAGSVLHMPNNGIIVDSMTGKRRREIQKTLDAKLERLSVLITARQMGKIETTNIFRHFVLTGLFLRAIPRLASLMLYVRRHGGWESLSFVSDDHCIGCGTCAKLCPADAITLVDGKPSWGENCLHCFACINWCPQHAIQAGDFSVGRKRYHHPDVSVSDIINQKQFSS
jgi:Pyruvate/2-oxoacid:ferredoxin oxidoreductase delta subunit/flavodoxin